MTMNMFRVAGALAAVFVAATPLVGQAASRPGAQTGTFTVFTAESSGTPPAAASTIGAVSDQICRRPWDLAASDAQALAPLEAKARALGANGLVDVKFDRHRSDLKSNCWQKVTVTGTAVVFAGASGR